MRDVVFGWWGHLPVVSGEINLGDFKAWHRRQLRIALQEASAKHAKQLLIIPKSGFQVLAIRSGRGDLGTLVAIKEDLSAYTGSPLSKYVAWKLKKESPDVLGVEDCFPWLLDEVATQLSTAWPEYLKWRRRLPWKPVPEWLVKLRAEERKAKRRKGCPGIGKAVELP